ncbi:MAG: PadR family transcriptional regulator [Gemmatimonadota bacterium]
MTRRMPLLRGTLDLLILKTLSLAPNHGFGIVRILDESTEGVFFVEEGSLYPALHRLQKKGLVQSTWGVSEAGRRAKFYELTKPGLDALRAETDDWSLVSASVAKVLALRPDPA